MARARKSWREKLENPVRGIAQGVRGAGQMGQDHGRPADPRAHAQDGRRLRADRSGAQARHRGPNPPEAGRAVPGGLHLPHDHRHLPPHHFGGRQRRTAWLRPRIAAPPTGDRRVIKDDGSLNAKFPGGVEGHAEKLRRRRATISCQASVRSRRKWRISRNRLQDFVDRAILPVYGDR